MSALGVASKITAGAFLLAALATTWARLALAFDGSFYLFWILESRSLVTPHNRLAVALLTLPAQIAANASENLELTSLVFCFTYAIFPFISILACWLIVRKKQIELMIWPLISIGLLSIPNQPNQISENLIVCQLAWPLLLSVLVLRGRGAIALNLSLAILLIALHPVSIIFLILASTAALLLSKKEIKKESNQQLAIVASALFLLGAARLIFLIAKINQYEQETLQVDSLYQMLRTGYSLYLILAVGTSLALSLIILKYKEGESALRLKLTLGWLFSIVSPTLMIIWSANLQCWYQSLHYGRFLFAPFCLLMIFAVVESITQITPDLRRRARLASAFALVFLCASLVQSYQWSCCTTRLKEALLNSKEVLLDISKEEWIASTPLNHWSCVPLAIILQGRYPQTLLLTTDARLQITKDGTFKPAPWENKFASRYFKLPPMVLKKQEI